MRKIVHKTLRQEVTETVRMQILTGELPPGTRIIEQEIAESLGVSRGPVRESLREMEQEGLVEYTRNVGCSVKEFSDVDIYEVYLIRAALEILAVKLCEGCISDENLREMEEILEQMSDTSNPDFFEHSIDFDNEFHACVVRQCGLKRLYLMWDSLNLSNMLVYYEGSADREAAKKRQKEIHQTVLEAYRTKDKAAISKAILEHYMLTIRRRLSEKGKSEKDFDYKIDISI